MVATESAVGLDESSDAALLQSYRAGNEQAATSLYLRYVDRLRRIAISRRSPHLASRLDPEDIVQSVFRRFFKAARGSRYDVPAEESLWKTLLVIALNHIRNTAQHHQAAKRDARITVGADGSESKEGESVSTGLLEVMVVDILNRFDDRHREVIELRLQGFEIAQIVAATNRSKRTIERILQECRIELERLLHEPDNKP